MPPYQVLAFPVETGGGERDPRRCHRSALQLQGWLRRWGERLRLHVAPAGASLGPRLAWRRGTAAARFNEPVYEGDIAEVSSVMDADGMALEGSLHGAPCTICATTDYTEMSSDLPSQPALADF